MRPRPAAYLPPGARALLRSEAAPGILLMAVAALAVALANSPLSHAYHDLLHQPLGWTPIPKLATAHLWINDAVMAVFFFVVGLEIKREVVAGELSTRQSRRLPVIAAAAGMAVPAAIYLAVAGGEAGLARGWAIPAATDIAFAVGVLALLGKRVPPALRVFLLTVAIVDDLGAVAIIALVYTADLSAIWLGAGALCLGALVALNRLGVRSVWPFLVIGLIAWYAVLQSGVHPTVAGVLTALAIPYALDRRGDSPLLRLEHALVPWSGFLIVPLFGFANAGVALPPFAALLAPLPLGIALGLFLGKQVGVFGSLWLAHKLGWGARLVGVSWAQVWGMALLCGIGFTMSLFIGALAFPGDPALVEEAKLGVLAGSLLSALAGYAVLRLAASKEPT